MKSLAGKPLLLNFWATWCPPCVEELPLINDFYLKNKASGWQVLGLAVDKLQPVQTFLQKSPLDFPVGMAGLAGTELTRAMGNLAGALPFSVVLGSDGSMLHRKMGRVSPEELTVWAGLK
jgi:thiol-disulfide isomerase/thioredoxin